MTTDIIISVKGLEKHFDEGKLKALQGIDCDIKRGEVVVVIGPSGSGKSTLVNLVCRFYEPTEGTLLIDGKEIDLNVYTGGEGERAV